MIDRIKTALASLHFNEFISNRVNQFIILFALVVLFVCMVGGFVVFVSATAPRAIIAETTLPAPAATSPGAVEQQVAVEAPSAAPNPAVSLPCKEPRLTAGTTVYAIRELEPDADGGVSVPSDPGSAYWVTGSVGGYVFGLGAVRQNLALERSLQSGDALQVVWADCSQEDFVVGSVEPGPVDATALLEATGYGLRVFVPGPDGFVVNGVRPGAPITADITAAPAEEQVLETAALGTFPDLELLDITLSSDSSSLMVIVAIANNGSQPEQVNTGDITLAEGEGQPQTPQSIEPALPLEIVPGQRVRFTVVFANPPKETARIKVISFSTDIFY